MTAETNPRTQEASPLDFSKMENLFKSLNHQEVDSEFQVAGTELADGTFIQIIKGIRYIRPHVDQDEKELTFAVNIEGKTDEYIVDNIPLPHTFQFELAENGLRYLRRSSVDISREPFAFDVSVGEVQIGRWWIHGRSSTLELMSISNPLLPTKASNVKAGELMVDWLQHIIETGSFSEPPINLNLVDPKTIE